MQAYCLSIHVPYRCRRSGVCCKAGWPIPIEGRKVLLLRKEGLPIGESRELFERDAGESYQVAKTAAGSCVFYDGHDRLCALQRDVGVDAMPATCRNFPRVALHDVRGTFITLSHFCPTAARLLLSTGPIEIVEAPRSISLDGEADGLDATGVMPPLLRKGMLMDWEGYTAWEREGVGVLDDPRFSARGALAVVSTATRDAVCWSPGHETLAERMSAAFDRARRTQAPEERAASRPLQRALKGFLAAHLFANWAVYHGGLGAGLENLERAFSLVGDNHEDESTFLTAVQRADLQLRHSNAGP